MANVGSGGRVAMFFSYVVNGRPVAVETSKYGKLPKDYQDPVWWGDLKRRLEDRGFELGLAGDDVIREINLDATFDEVLQQALLSMGIVKIGLVAEGTAESESYLQDADQPYVEPVLLEDFAYDTAAKSWDQVDFAANRYRVPLIHVLGNPLFGPAATEELSPSDSRNSEELRGDGVDDNSVQRLGTGSNSLREEIREYVTFWDVPWDDARASYNHESLDYTNGMS